MRVPVLPRDEAAKVITGAAARSVWAVNVANLALTFPVLIEYFVARNLASALPIPIGILIVMIGLAAVAALRPRLWSVVTFLVVGSVGAFAYQLVLFSAVPDIAENALFLLNRPAVSLVLVAVGATTLVSGVAWIVGGYLTSTLVSVAVALTLSQPVRTGWGPALVLGIYVLAFVMLSAIQVSARRKVPNLEELEAQTQLAAVEENLREKVTAAVHDTLLNDLSLIMNSPEVLDERVTTRLKQDLATLTGAEWLRESSEVVVDAQTSALLNRFMQLVSDLQWRGLTVEVTGVGVGIYSLDPAVANALVGAVQASLENALMHSGVTVAELDLAFSDDAITAIVADQGRGFDPASIPPDRLGVRHSVIERLETVGGTARVWSSPDAGTSIVMRVPVLQVISHHEESDHGSAT